jgi:MFS family permease
VPGEWGTSCIHGGTILLVSLPQTEPVVLSEGNQPLLTRRELLGISVLWFGLNFQFAALLPIVVPAQILLLVTPGSAGTPAQALVLGALAALGAVTAVILQPLVGAASDRTSSRLGRRRPYIIAGGMLMLVGLTLLAASHLIVLYIVGLFLVVVANTVSGTACQGLVPDRVPPRQRGVASGYMGLMTILGTVGSLAVASTLLGASSRAGSGGTIHGAALFYGLAGVVLVVSLTLTLLGVREAPHLHPPGTVHGLHGPNQLRTDRSAGSVEQAGESPRPSLRQRLSELWTTPWQHPNFTWVFLTRGFVMLGLALFMTYIEYYFARVQHLTNFIQATAFNAILALLGAVCSTLLLGILSDRTRRVPIVFFSTACMALAALTFVVAPGRLPLWPLGILFGLGYGAYMSVDVALAVDTLPSRHDAGKDLGIWNIASTLQSLIAPLLGSLVIFVAGHFGLVSLGYRTIFGMATLFLLLGAVFVLKVRESHHHEKR